MKIDRKKFFLIGSMSFLGAALLKRLPFSLFAKKDATAKNKLTVKINPLAVSRSNEKEKNA